MQRALGRPAGRPTVQRALGRLAGRPTVQLYV